MVDKCINYTLQLLIVSTTQGILQNALQHLLSKTTSAICGGDF